MLTNILHELVLNLEYEKFYCDFIIIILRKTCKYVYDIQLNQSCIIIRELFLVGSYFGSHFIMGGERFDTPQPEAYLFGENADLNFLGSRPTPV